MEKRTDLPNALSDDKLRRQAIALAQRIEVLGLSIRPFNALKRAGIEQVFDLAVKTADELSNIRNLGTQSLAEIQLKLQQYLEANSISLSEILPLTGKLEGLLASPSAQAEAEMPIATGALQPVLAEADSTVLSLSELLETTLLQAVQYPHMTPESWADFVTRCKIKPEFVRRIHLENVSIYGKSAVSTDPRLLLNLGVRALNALQRAGIYDLDSVYRLKVRDLASIRQIGRDTVIQLFRFLKSELPNFVPESHRIIKSIQSPVLADGADRQDAPTNESVLSASPVGDTWVGQPAVSPEQRRWLEICRMMNDELRLGKLHPKVRAHGFAIAEWLQAETEKRHDRGLRFICDTFERRLSHMSINEEIAVVLTWLSARHLGILVAKFGKPSQTLQEIAEKHGVTRERARQLAKRAQGIVVGWFEKLSPWRLQTALLLADELGDQISLPKWESVLIERDLLETSPLPCGTDLQLPALDLVLVLLKANEDAETPVPEYRIPENLRVALEYPGFTAGEVGVVQKLSKKELRTIRRQCRNAGAVSVILLSRQLKIPVSVLRKALSLHGYTPLNDEWLTIMPPRGTPVSSRHSAFQANVIKMLAICGPLSLEMVRQGLQNHTSRLGFAVPSSAVLAKLLSLYGFRTDSDNRVLPMGVRVAPNRTEKIILNLIHQRGPVVNFQELSEQFSRKGRSQPSLALALRYSGLFHRVDSGLYTLRGARITREDVEAALARRPEVDRDSVLHFSPKGIVTWEINVGAFGVGGTIPAGEAARLAGEWNATVEEKDMGRIKVGEQQIWGLAKAFRKLGVKVGERIALHFDTRTRQVQVVKLRGKTNEEDRTV